MNREFSGRMDIHITHDLSTQKNAGRDHVRETGETEVFVFSKIEMRINNGRIMQ
ncbi:MAG TPA: hypothetical protein P5346_12540 [Spirochaetota bacterium]|nr:hypothetical protein [Syntrophorhabdaceae bacterium]HSA15562.1 hypothetical protein [Spirochaetota bacterium]